MMTRAKVKRALGYVRVSTAEQANSGAGLAAQRKAIRDECKRRGWELVEILADKGYSAGSLKRPAVQDAFERLGARDRAQIVAKLDRLSRSLLDFAGTVERAKSKGWAVLSLDNELDMTTPQGKMMVHMLAVFAEFERERIGERNVEALAVKRAEGVQLGRPRQLAPKVVARIKGLRTRGHSLAAIAERLNSDDVPTAHGGAKWHPSTVKAVLDRVQQ
jgi:DNA invertase Pin-like site-specific DNA recombinase